MKLLKYELKKLFSSKGILLLIAVLLAANAVLCFLSPSKTADHQSDEKYIAGYQNDIRRVIRLAELNIADLSGGGDGYIIDYQEKVIEKYSALINAGQTPEPVIGYEEYILFSGQITLLLVLAVVIGSAVALCEKDAGMKPFLGISKKGRRVYVVKLLSLLYLSITITAIYSLTGMIVCGIRYGFSGVFAPLVSVQSLEFCPYHISILGYIGILFVMSVLLTFALSVLSALVGKLSGNYLLTFLCGGAVCAGFYISGFDINNYFIRYRAVNMFGIAVDAFPVALITLLFICAVLCTIFCFLGNKQTTLGDKLHKAELMLLCSIRSIFKRFTKIRKPRRTKRHDLYLYELKKVFISSKLILLVILLLGAKLYVGIGDISRDDLYEKEYYRLCAELSGELTDEKSAYIASGLAECESVISQHEAMRNKVQNGQITSGEYDEYLQKLYAAEVKQAAFSKLNEQKSHIEELRTEGKYAEIIYDTGWKSLFFAEFDAYLYALILFLFAGIYTFEYKNGMNQLLLSVKNGGHALNQVKFVSAITVTAVLCLIFTSVDITFVIKQYPLENLSAPALSIIGISSDAVVSIILYTVLCVLKKIISFSLLAIVVCLASKLLHKLYLIIPAVVILTLLPHLLIRNLPQWLDFTVLLTMH